MLLSQPDIAVYEVDEQTGYADKAISAAFLCNMSASHPACLPFCHVGIKRQLNINRIIGKFKNIPRINFRNTANTETRGFNQFHIFENTHQFGIS
jgi:hypothetical protein